jgi:hypothetical protein
LQSDNKGGCSRIMLSYAYLRAFVQCLRHETSTSPIIVVSLVTGYLRDLAGALAAKWQVDTASLSLNTPISGVRLLNSSMALEKVLPFEDPSKPVYTPERFYVKR